MYIFLLILFWLFCLWFCVSGTLKYIRVLRAFDKIVSANPKCPYNISWEGFELPRKTKRMPDHELLIRSILIGPVRFGLFIISILTMMTLIAIAGRRYSHSISKYMSRVTLMILGLELVVSGSLAEPTKAPLIVANHVGMIDVFVLLALDGMSFVADNAIRRFFIIGRIWGYVAEMIDCLFLSRSNESSRQQVRTQLMERIREISAGQKPRLAIFPEGTTSNGRGILSFKYGAFEGMTTCVQPVTLNYSNKEWGYCSVWSEVYFAYIMSLPRSKITVNILPPQSAQADDTPQTYGDRVREMMLGESSSNNKLLDFQHIHNPSRTHNHIGAILDRHT
jgi:1-acyl-sn-glycerol-3-phosphate acyltransferase